MLLQSPRLVNLSLPKTGSTTIGRIFEPVGGTHEGLHDLTVGFILDYLEGLITHQQLSKLLVRRQRLIRATVDSSTFLHLVAPEVYKLLPPSTLYLQVLRDPMSWAESYLSMLVGVGASLVSSPSNADLAWTSRYGSYQAAGLDPVTLYHNLDNEEYIVPIVLQLFLFWRRSVLRVQNAIPPSQLCATPLTNLAKVIPMLADLIQVPLDSLNMNALMSNIGSRVPGIRNVIANHVSAAIQTDAVGYARAVALYSQICETDGNV